MTKLMSYLLEVNITLVVFYLVYLVLFSKDSNFRLRRIFLLFTMIFSLSLPFISFPTSYQPSPLPGAIVQLEEIIKTARIDTIESTGVSYRLIPVFLYLIISILFLAKLFISVFKIIRVPLRRREKSFKGTGYIPSEELHASSFFSYIFLDPEQLESENLDLILKHEQEHARLYHSIDRLIAEIFICINWINPMSWMLRRSIVINHEYQADNRVIEQGNDQITYQLSILNQYIGSASISNQFSSQIKNRIKMLNKNYKKSSSWKSLILIPVSAFLLFFIACSTENTNGNEAQAGDENVAPETETLKDLSEEAPVKAPEEEIFYIVENMPKWTDGTDFPTGMRKFVAKNLIYPDKAKKAGATGKVFVRFIVTNTGEIIIPDPSKLPPVKEGEGDENEVVVVAYQPLNSGDKLPEQELIDLFKKESVRVIEAAPDVIPGTQRGKKVNVIFTMPFSFLME